jgi:hypothetical protein
VQETKETKAAPNPAQPVAKTLERVMLAVDREVLNPLQRKHDVLCTFAEALEVIRKTDNLTRGIPKIV